MSEPEVSSEIAPADAIIFATTHWSVVLEAGQSASPRATEALERLCRSYWRPLYAFVRRQGYRQEEAQDLTQSFFSRLLERRDLENVRREKGRFRSYLLVSLKRFLINEWHRAHTAKRGGAQIPIPLEHLLAEDGCQLELSNELAPDKIFERRWALTVLDHVLTRLGQEFGGDRRVLECWKQTLNEEGGPRQAELAAQLGMNENSLKQAFHRLRQRYRQLLREEIANTVATPGEIEDELRHLISVLRG